MHTCARATILLPVNYNFFTLTNLSTAPNSICAMCFKSNFAHTRLQCNMRFSMMEHCKNPWKSSCKSGNIQLYIEFKGEKLPICKRCWSHIADKELNWDD
jgi:hypothetical protein